MKAIKPFGPRNLKMVEVSDPEPASDEVLIKIKASGICGSDMWVWRVDEAVDEIGGHEIGGKIIEVGSDVQNLEVGDRVAVNNVVGCGSCKYCRTGRFVLCSSRPGTDVNGGFGELVTAPARNCLPLKEGVSYEDGALIFDNWGTPYAALERVGASEKDDIIVFGCGPIGLAAVALARRRNAFVIGVDPVPERRQEALKAGAGTVLDPREVDIEKQVKEITGGRGADIAVECSGKGVSYENGFKALRVKGTFIAVGENARYELKPSQLLIRKNLNLIGSWYSTMREGLEVQDLIKAEKIDPTRFVTHRIDLEDVPDLFEDIFNYNQGIIKVLIKM